MEICATKYGSNELAQLQRIGSSFGNLDSSQHTCTVSGTNGHLFRWQADDGPF